MDPEIKASWRLQVPGVALKTPKFKNEATWGRPKNPTKNRPQHRPQVAALAHQHLQKHPPNNGPSKTRPSIEQKCARTITLKSTPNSTPEDTQPSILRTSTSTPNRIPNHHLSCMPPCTLPSRCQHASAPSPACPIAPERQYRKNAPAPSPAPQTAPHKLRPTAPSAAAPHTAFPLASYRQYANMRSHRHPPKQHRTPNCMPPSTLPSILKRCTRTAISTSNSTPMSTYTSTPNRTPPSTSPISQITFPSLLEVRTPYSFQLSGKNAPMTSSGIILG